MSTASSSSHIVTPKPGASIRMGQNIDFSYDAVFNAALYLAPSVDVLLQKEGEDFAIELATGLTPSADNAITHTIPLSSFSSIEAGEYKLVTVERDTQKIRFRDGSLTIRKVTGDQTLRLIENLGPGPVVPPVQLEPGPVIES